MKNLLEIIQDTSIRRIDNNHVEVRTPEIAQDFLTLSELSTLLTAITSLQYDLMEELDTQIIRKSNAK